MISSQFSISSRATRTFNTKLLEKIAVALMIKPNSSKLELRTSMLTWRVRGSFSPVVSESRFFNLETRMRVSPIQSRSSRRDREFLTLTLGLWDETEKKFPPISGIEMRSRFIIFTLRLRDENENSLDLISFFETRPRILKLDIFPWNQAFRLLP